MFDKLFDENLQIKMTNFFANELSKKGSIKKYKKKEYITHCTSDSIYIVISGQITQIIISNTGDEVCLFRLQRGTILGEMNFFEGQHTEVIAKVIEDCEISLISKAVLENELLKHPEIYRYFMHSIIRKYRILMLNIADYNFNNAIGKVANCLLRLAHTSKFRYKSTKSIDSIEFKITHEELANRIGCNRTTVTNAINKFRSESLIEIDKKRIIIKNKTKLQEYVNYHL
ncbi:Crp/Fnr family transcriptional regulator [Clostridiaceae bacterium M8S5]|nr:Crp/Fnr family transcriptional regulator [Clostridiaceae bacterium M8S5]